MRDLVFPAVVVLGVFVATGLLVVAGHYDRFSEATQDASASTRIERYQQLHAIASGEAAAQTAATVLSPGRDPGSTVARLAYRTMFELSSPVAATHVLLSAGSFYSGSRLVQGWDSAADLVFGSKIARLTDSELGLYAYWIVHGQDQWGPDDLIKTRRLVLDRLVDGDLIDQETHRALNAAALVLRPTPIPIN